MEFIEELREVIKESFKSTNVKDYHGLVMKNTAILKNITAYETSNSDKFLREIDILEKQNYTITKHVLDDNGIYKLIAELKPANLVQCILREQQRPENDRVLNFYPTKPEKCVFL